LKDTTQISQELKVWCGKEGITTRRCSKMGSTEMLKDKFKPWCQAEHPGKFDGGNYDLFLKCRAMTNTLVCYRMLDWVCEFSGNNVDFAEGTFDSTMTLHVLDTVISTIKINFSGSLNLYWMKLLVKSVVPFALPVLADLVKLKDIGVPVYEGDMFPEWIFRRNEKQTKEKLEWLIAPMANSKIFKSLTKEQQQKLKAKNLSEEAPNAGVSDAVEEVGDILAVAAAAAIGRGSSSGGSGLGDDRDGIVAMDGEPQASGRGRGKRPKGVTRCQYKY